MIKFEKLDTNGFPLYIVDEVENWNKFTEWLYRLEDKEMSLSFKSNLYRFRTVEERIQFVFGFMKAWDIIDDAYLEKRQGVN